MEKTWKKVAYCGWGIANLVPNRKRVADTDLPPIPFPDRENGTWYVGDAVNFEDKKMRIATNGIAGNLVYGIEVKEDSPASINKLRRRIRDAVNKADSDTITALAVHIGIRLD